MPRPPLVVAFAAAAVPSSFSRPSSVVVNVATASLPPWGPRPAVRATTCRLTPRQSVLPVLVRAGVAAPLWPPSQFGDRPPRRRRRSAALRAAAEGPPPPQPAVGDASPLPTGVPDATTPVASSNGLTSSSNGVAAAGAAPAADDDTPPVAEDCRPPAQRARRAYSNVDPVSFERRPGSLLAAAALVTGTTVGAGVLAMPAVTASSGWLPSSAALVGVWAVAAAEALLLAEVAVNTQCALGRPTAVSILSMARATLGDRGAAVTSGAYVLKYAAVLVAYVAQGGTIVAETTARLPWGGLPTWAAGPAFAASMGAFLWAAPDALVAMVNNWLVAATVALFAGLVFFTAGDFQPAALLTERHWASVIPDALPVLLVSLTYHNTIPYLCSYLEGDRTKIRAAVVGGSALPLAMFLLWNAVILGSGDVQAAVAAAGAAAAATAAALASGGAEAAGATASAASAAAAAASAAPPPLFDPVAWLRNGGNTTGALVSGFSLLAIITSVVGNVTGLVDFVNDGFLSSRLLSNAQVRRYSWAAYLVTLVPPTVIAVVSPDAFFWALDLAGIYGVSVLFGVLPCAMAWRLRDGEGGLGAPYPPLVPGGGLLLGALAAGPALLVTSAAASHVAGLFH
ncbi:hypothetical protein I4F81_009535 [Pyropia yezoensis]|uniref:Uncharacterized protein n=1 Tax=Pyropia yezoensis TaxID=2788 RepID=A0ACC3CA86_PYRYE|nr:hypothetical protein I4F81_009535 [Neopyropia yezoensis]